MAFPLPDKEHYDDKQQGTTKQNILQKILTVNLSSRPWLAGLSAGQPQQARYPHTA
jgi:hypothetical protein